AGFHRHDERDSRAVEPGRGYFGDREGAIMAWMTPTETTSVIPPFRVLGSHTDSPAFKLKPGEEFATAGVRQVGVEIYGGPLLNSWLDRELAFAGRLSLADGTVVLARTGAIARIPQ
ncbi:M18 family aminopeptidase, partial [Burkholderia multivorans]